MSSVDPMPLRVGACLSLSGRFARFGRQAAWGLEVWRSLDGAAELVIEDDQSDPATLRAALPRVASRCDVLLGPYSTQLARTANRMAAAADWLLWNHGGAGDDIQAAFPGHVISILTPTSRYAEPFLRLLTTEQVAVRLVIVHSTGRFGRQVADGAEATARQLGIPTTRLNPGDDLTSMASASPWDLLSAGVFEDDARLVRQARRMAVPPRLICSVAAGVNEFGDVVREPDGIFGGSNRPDDEEPLVVRRWDYTPQVWTDKLHLHGFTAIEVRVIPPPEGRHSTGTFLGYGKAQAG